MSTELAKKLNNLQQHNPEQQRKVYVIGAAFVDLVMNIPALPEKGSDVFARSSAVTVGGCALNIVRILKGLGADFVPAIPVGNGPWAAHVKTEMAVVGIESPLHWGGGDNGWCVALVEDDAERTFVSSAGIDSHWTREKLKDLQIEKGSLVFISGYQLTPDSGEVFMEWMGQRDRSITILLDLGPVLDEFPAEKLQRLVNAGVLFTLNRRESEIMASEQTVNDFCQQLTVTTEEPVIVRLDKDGADIYASGQQVRHAEPFRTDVVDTIGAGDAHAAGVLFGLAHGFDIADAVTLGNGCASYAVSKAGACRGIAPEKLSQVISN